MLVARAIMPPSFLLNVGVSKDAISLPYIQSSADLSELRTGDLLSTPFCETCFLIRSDLLTRSDSMFFALWRTPRGAERRSFFAGILLLVDLHAARNNHVRIFVLA